MAEEKKQQQDASQEEAKEEAKEEETSTTEEAKEEETSTTEEAKEEETSTTEEEVEVPKKFKSLVEEIEKMSVLDLSELVKILESKFGVSAAAPAAAVAGGAQGGEDAPAEEKTEFDVELSEAGSNKIGVIKAVREITEIGLKDAKELVDGAPKVVKEAAKKEEAEEMKAKIEEAGGKVTLK